MSDPDKIKGIVSNPLKLIVGTNQFMHAGSRLPTEIVGKIISQFDSYRSALHPLLFVSWETYHLAVPLLYESIAIALNPVDIPPLGVSAVVINRLRVPQLRDTLEAQESTGRRVGIATIAFLLLPSLEDETSLVEDTLLNDVSTVLHHFVNLKKLYISSLGRHDADLREIIPSYLSLTHLTISSAYYTQIIGVLRSQPSLQVVCVKPLTSSQCEEKDALQLPHLTSFSAPMSMWDCLSPDISPLRFLTSQITRTPPAAHPLLPTIKNLTVIFMHDAYTLAIFSQLQRVEYLRVSVGYMLGGIEEFTKKLKKIPSSSLKYLALSVQHQSIADSIHPTFQSLFAAIPSLLVIDIFEPMPSSGPPTSTRLVREDVIVPTVPVVDEDVVENLSTLWHGVDEGAESRMLIEIVNM